MKLTARTVTAKEWNTMWDEARDAWIMSIHPLHYAWLCGVNQRDMDRNAHGIFEQVFAMTRGYCK